MAKNTNFTLGLNRQELKNKAMELGKTQQQVNKANSKTLENYIRKNTQFPTSSQPATKEKRTRKGKDTNFQLGIGRTELKRLASNLGFKGDVNKANTKRLEKFIQDDLIGKGKTIELTEPMKRDIEGMFHGNYSRGKAYIAEKLARVAGISYDTDKALSLEIEKQFSVFYDGNITKQMVDELMNVRMQYRYNGEAFNGLKNTFEYVDLFKNYARELTEKNGGKYGM